MPLRFDSGKIITPRKDYKWTDEGFLQITAIVTRTGVFNYRNNDGSLRRELRHPDDVFLSNSLETLKLIPVTNNHPTEMVNIDNVKKYQVGNTGENVIVDGKYIRLPLTIQDKSGIDAIMDGKNELSLGYMVVAVDEAGEYDGISYDVRQTEIKYNHLAIVDSARAGSMAKIILDSADAFIIDENSEPIKTKKKGLAMPKFNIDGIEYDAAQEVINHASKLMAKIDELEKKGAKISSSLSKMEAERDDISQKMDALKTEYSAENIQKRIDARLDLLSKAQKILGDVENLAKMDDKEIKIAVLKKAYDSIDLEGRTDEYINARFDICIEDKKNADTTGDQLKEMNTDSGEPKPKLDAVAARKSMFEKMQKRSYGEK